MSKVSSNRKTLFVGLAWFVGVLVLLLLTQQAYQYQQSTYCSNIDIQLMKSKSADKGLSINKKEVEQFFINQLPGKTINGVQVGKLDLEELEIRLQTNPYIEKADIYTDTKGTIHIDIKQRHPLVRVVTKQNTNFYLSKEGKKMPANGQFSARVPIATGNINDTQGVADTAASPRLKAIWAIADYIDQHPFWKANIEQITVANNGDITLIPKLANHHLLLGSADDLPNKFNRLLTFYQDALNQVGWYKYKTISVKYNKQIICTEK